MEDRARVREPAWVMAAIIAFRTQLGSSSVLCGSIAGCLLVGYGMQMASKLFFVRLLSRYLYIDTKQVSARSRYAGTRVPRTGNDVGRIISTLRACRVLIKSSQRCALRSLDKPALLREDLPSVSLIPERIANELYVLSLSNDQPDYCGAPSLERTPAVSAN